MPHSQPTTIFGTCTVPVREAGAWLRGRYPGLSVTHFNEVSTSISAPGTNLLTVMPWIVGLVSQSPAHDANLTRGQYFAILRLACSRWSRVGQKPRFQTRFRLTPRFRPSSSPVLMNRGTLSPAARATSPTG